MSTQPDVTNKADNLDSHKLDLHKSDVRNTINGLIDETHFDTASLAQIVTYLSSLPLSTLLDLSHTIKASDFIIGFVDGSGMACPMPLLKTKVALRNIATSLDHKALYVVATDPHSQADIAAFCQQTEYTLLLNTASDLDGDTIFHFIITKTDSN